MSTAALLLVIFEGVQAPLIVLGVVALFRGGARMSRKLDRLVEIVAPDDDPAQRLDRRTDRLEQFRDAHVAWHRAAAGEPG